MKRTLAKGIKPNRHYMSSKVRNIECKSKITGLLEYNTYITTSRPIKIIKKYRSISGLEWVDSKDKKYFHSLRGGWTDGNHNYLYELNDQDKKKYWIKIIKDEI